MRELNTANIQQKGINMSTVVDNLKEDKILIDTIFYVSQFAKINTVWGREILRTTPHETIRDFYVSTSGAEWGRLSVYPMEGDTVEVSRFGAIDDIPIEGADENGDVRISVREIPNLFKRLGLKPRRPEEVRKDRPKMSFCDRWDDEHEIGHEPLHKLLPHLKPKVGPRLEARVFRVLAKNFALENSPWENSPWEDGYSEQPWAIRVFPTWGFRGKRAERIIRTLEGFHDAIYAARCDSDFSEKFGVTWAAVTSWIESALYHTRAMKTWGPRVARQGIAF